MLRKLKQLGWFVQHVMRRFDQDHCLQLASSLTFTTLLALVPLVTIALTLISAFPVFSGLGEQTQNFLLANILPATAGKVITGYIEQFSDRTGQLTALGTAGIAVTAFMMMFTIERAFNSIWRVSRQRAAAQRILVYWAVLTLGPILIGLSLSITSYVTGVSLGLAQAIPFAPELIPWLVPFGLTWAAFTLLYFTVPNRAVERRHALLGGVVAAIAFEIMKRGFALYVTRFPTYTVVYGAFAAIPIFLLWIYFSWVVVIVGALIAAAAPDYSVLRGGGRRASGAAFGEALALLKILWQAQQRGEQLDLPGIAHRAMLTRDQAEPLLERMAARGWIEKSGGERFRLVCDAEILQVAEIYREFVLDARDTAEAEPVKLVLERFAQQADSALELPLRRLFDEKPG